MLRAGLGMRADRQVYNGASISVRDIVNPQCCDRLESARCLLYFTGAGGTSPFVLTTQVLAEPLWTRAVLEARQAKVLHTLAKLWRLD